jgi:hypothetical protein
LEASSFAAQSVLLLARRQIRAANMRHFRSHAKAFAKSWVWVDSFADIAP